MSEDTSSWIEFPCIKVSQPIGEFYVGVLDSKPLVGIAYADVRTISEERRDVETYLGIERPLNEKRVKEIAAYVRTVDAAFPSAIILAVGSKDAEYDSEKGILRIRNSPDAARILDGQHRLAGLKEYDRKNFKLIVTFFIDMDIENQALLFATINLEQTKVNKSLTYDLYEYAKARSPQKTCHNIVRFLDSEEGSPFHKKIKILGNAEDPEETISQGTFVDALLPLITENAMRDRDLLKRGEELDRAGEGERRRIFQNMFIDERDGDITLVLWHYFGAAMLKWPKAWQGIAGNVLSRTTGFYGLMLFLPFVYSKLKEEHGDVPSTIFFGQVLKAVTLTEDEMTSDNFPTGGRGRVLLRDRLREETGLL